MRVIFFYILFFGTFGVQAQTYKFGDVPREQLEMEVYDKDSTARAVVIFSKGDSELEYYNDDFYLTVTRHFRIKILTDEGLEEGEIELEFRNKNANTPQDIKNIKAESYFLDETGKILKQSVGRRDRFEEDISETRSVIKFTIPGLKKGSVFEYSYQLTSNNPLDFPSWVFQDDIPVIWSEYNARIPEWFRFLTVSKGYQNFLVSEQKRYNDRITIQGKQRQVFNGSNVSFVQDPSTTIDYEGIEYRYVVNNMPAIANEPYMKASMDYLSHIRFQLSSIQFPQTLGRSYLDTWVDLVNRLEDDEDFGKRLEKNEQLDEILEGLTEPATTELEKMITIYNYISNHMVWNGNYGLYSFKNLEDVYKEGTANGSSINLLLVQMLRKAGFEAHPMILSTRFNGEIIDLFPLVGQFNHTIAYVQFDGGYFLLDAKNENRPYNLLPSQVLNGEGLIIYKDQVLWVPLENQVDNKSVNVLSIDINEDGYEGSIKSKNLGFYAVDKRNGLDFEDLTSSVNEEIFIIDSGFSIDSVFITKDKLDESFEFEADFSFTNDLPTEVIYFNPMITGAITENPFKLEDRTFPIDFDYTFSETIIMNINIPEGWIIDEIPQSVLYRLPDQSGELRRIVRSVGDTISMNYLFKINKTRFMPEEYPGLKQFYEHMVETLGQNIVLKKGS
ncbi:MAG: DUF3857 domain-containing protein [Balneolaceae bacterium]